VEFTHSFFYFCIDFAEAARSDEPPSATQSKIAAVVEESPKEATTTGIVPCLFLNQLVLLKVCSCKNCVVFFWDCFEN